MAEDYGATGGGKYVSKPRGIEASVKKPTAPATSTSSFSKVGGAIAPAANYSPASNPYRSAPIPVSAPSYGGGMQQQLATPSFGIGTPDSGSYGGGGAPAAQSRPVMSEGDWLSGDGEYQNQMNEFGATLTDFLARLTRQKDEFTQDYDVASKGLERNAAQGLQGVGEDFTSRGLANSGLFANARKEAETGFQNQRDGMNTAKSRAFSDFDTQKRDKEASTEQARGNAKRSSLSRMAMQQAF